jgi:predicted SAM-dependent methyltransferase
MKSLSFNMDFLRGPLILIRNKCRRVKQTRALKRLSSQSVRRIIVGSAGTRCSGWEPADKESLNLVRENDWSCYFKPNSIDAVLAEHVWEHLTPKEATIAASIIFRYLKPGTGYIRVAVPDGLHPDRNYIESVKPDGKGVSADNHKVLFTYHSIMEIFTRVGFDVSLLEYFDELGEFHGTYWNPEDGHIQRSKLYDFRNFSGKLAYTSIILDAIKPASNG